MIRRGSVQYYWTLQVRFPDPHFLVRKSGEQITHYSSLSTAHARVPIAKQWQMRLNASQLFPLTRASALRQLLLLFCWRVRKNFSNFAVKLQWLMNRSTVADQYSWLTATLEWLVWEASSRNLFFPRCAKDQLSMHQNWSLFPVRVTLMGPTYCKTEEAHQQNLNSHSPHLLLMTMCTSPSPPCLLLQLVSCSGSCQRGLCAPTGATAGR